MMYAGSERGHGDTGLYRVRIWFTWPDGQRGEHELAPEPLSDSEARVRGYSLGGLALVSEGNGPEGIHYVRVERCRIEDPTA